MYFKEIENWLRTTVWGIIFLGAIGSIFAFFIIKLCNYLCNIKFGIPKGREMVYRHGYLHGYVMGILEDSKNPVLIQIYVAYHLARLIVLIILSVSFMALFFYLLPEKENILLNFNTFISVFIAILSGIFAYFEFIKIGLAYKALLAPLFEQAREKYKNSKSGSD
jgi:hypothetical protein